MNKETDFVFSMLKFLSKIKPEFKESIDWIQDEMQKEHPNKAVINILIKEIHRETNKSLYKSLNDLVDVIKEATK